MSAADVAARLPEIEVVRAWSRSLAVLDAIMSPEWQYRYFSFDPAWGGVDEMASMRNGSGDEYSIVFDKQGAFIRGFGHESSLSPWAQDPPGVVAGLLDDVPAVFQDQLAEPAFAMDGILAITVCIWRRQTDSRWHAGRVADPALAAEDDSAVWLFELLDSDPSVRGTAGLCLGHVARRFGCVQARSWEVVRRLCDDPAVDNRPCDGLDDLRVFAGPEPDETTFR